MISCKFIEIMIVDDFCDEIRDISGTENVMVW